LCNLKVLFTVLSSCQSPRRARLPYLEEMESLARTWIPGNTLQLSLQSLSPDSNEALKTCLDYSQMAQQTAVNNALGTLLGYVGSEATTPDIFERLLWPARFYGGFNILKVPKMAFLMPMGGPLHKAALMTIDKICSSGLFKGRNQGHMLGSPFYRDTGIKYTVYDSANMKVKEKEHVRNGFWIRVLSNMPMPEYKNYGTKDHPEGYAVQARAIYRVSYMRFSVPANKPRRSQVINCDVESTSGQTYLALVVTEITGIVVAISVTAIWKSWLMVIWLVPLTLKLASAFLAVDRHPLEIPTSTPPSQCVESTQPRDQYELVNKDQEKHLLPSRSKKFEINGPSHGFLIIEGDERLVVQFFRHYGHPIRNRFREYAQIIIIVLLGFHFPISLLCSLLWMPLHIQYVWMSYQLYAMCAMLVYRHAGGQTWATTEERVAKAFASAAAKGQPQRVFLGGKQGVLMAELEATYHDRYRDGKSHSDELLYSRSLSPRSAETSSTVQSNSETSSNASDSPRSLTPTDVGKREV
jgi:hypothetical protein